MVVAAPVQQKTESEEEYNAPVLSAAMCAPCATVGPKYLALETEAVLT